ncbi:MAG: hypothetical protein ACE5ID_08320 [Acidobacteriota bacterium]
MLKRKNRIAILAATGAVAAMMVGGLVVGSNMGLKGRFQLTGGVDQWFAPPFNNPYVDAKGLLNVLAPTSGGVLTRFVATSPPATQFWTGTAGNGNPPNFILEKGEAYQVRPTVSEDVIVVGSHDPFATVPSGQRGIPNPADPTNSLPPIDVAPGFTKNVDDLVSIPWHTTYATANDLLTDLPNGGTVTRISQAVGSPASFEFWNGTGGNASPPNFAIDLGRGYLLRVLVTSPGFVPAHF